MADKFLDFISYIVNIIFLFPLVYPFLPKTLLGWFPPANNLVDSDLTRALVITFLLCIYIVPFLKTSVNGTKIFLYHLDKDPKSFVLRQSVLQQNDGDSIFLLIQDGSKINRWRRFLSRHKCKSLIRIGYPLGVKISCERLHADFDAIDASETLFFDISTHILMSGWNEIKLDVSIPTEAAFRGEQPIIINSYISNDNKLINWVLSLLGTSGTCVIKINN